MTHHWHDMFPKLSEIGLDSLQQAKVLEWYATRVWALYEEHDPEYYGKSYDPLRIDLTSDGTGTAHSYALSIQGSDNGRHHAFESMDELERRITQPLIDWIKEQVADANKHRDAEWDAEVAKRRANQPSIEQVILGEAE